MLVIDVFARLARPLEERAHRLRRDPVADRRMRAAAVVESLDVVDDGVAGLLAGVSSAQIVHLLLRIAEERMVLALRVQGQGRCAQVRDLVHRVVLQQDAPAFDRRLEEVGGADGRVLRKARSGLQGGDGGGVIS